ncbi:MAG: fasciclin domain-containing protein [Acidobacteriales bacterium]|nr:fasciclin domain-containing protein [Terriglobales bacterium]
MKRMFAAFAATVMTVAAASAQQPDLMVGGAPMSPKSTIVENASKASNLTTLVTAVKAAGLVDTLSGPGPFTVFAPPNEAFDKLPAGTVDTLLKPESKDELTKVLTYHVVPGKLDAKTLIKKVKAGHGTAELTTVEGEKLTAMMSADGKGLQLKDAKGNIANVSTADVYQSNGIVHVIDAVLLP